MMFAQIGIDCLNHVFSFSTPKEMGTIMCVSKECKALVRKCEYAWYEMYLRLYKKYNKKNCEHTCNYSIDCLRNNCFVKDRKNKEYLNTYSKIMEFCYKEEIIKKYPSLFFQGRNFIHIISYLNIEDEKRYNIDMNYINQFPSIKNNINEVCEMMKICVNVEHGNIPMFTLKKNYRKEMRIILYHEHKRLRFTDKDEEKLQALLRKKRLCEFVAKYE